MRPCDLTTFESPLRASWWCKVWLALAATAIALSSLACGKAPDALPNAPHPRVVSLAPALTAVVHAIGADAHLVGVTAYCDAPGVPVVGDFAPRPEAVLAQGPDVVLMAGYAMQAPTASALSELGLDVRTLPLVTLGDMRRTTLAIGGLLDREQEAAKIVGAFDDALANGAPPAGSEPVKVLLVYDLQPGIVTTTGGGDHIVELLAALGGDNLLHAAGGGPLTARIGLERVLQLKPDLILHVAPDPARFPDSAAARTYWAEWRELPAVARGQVEVFPDDALARNGPHLARVVPRLVTMLAAARAARDR